MRIYLAKDAQKSGENVYGKIMQKQCQIYRNVTCQGDCRLVIPIFASDKAPEEEHQVGCWHYWLALFSTKDNHILHDMITLWGFNYWKLSCCVKFEYTSGVPLYSPHSHLKRKCKMFGKHEVSSPARVRDRPSVKRVHVMKIRAPFRGKPVLPDCWSLEWQPCSRSPSAHKDKNTDNTGLDANPWRRIVLFTSDPFNPSLIHFALLFKPSTFCWLCM